MKKQEILCIPKLRVFANDNEFFVAGQKYVQLILNAPDEPHNTVILTLQPKYKDRTDTILKFLKENALILLRATLYLVESPRGRKFIQLYAHHFSCFKKDKDKDALPIEIVQKMKVLKKKPNEMLLENKNTLVGIRFLKSLKPKVARL